MLTLYSTISLTCFLPLLASASIRFSENLQFFLDSTLDGCTFRVIFDPTSSRAEKIFSKINRYSDISIHDKRTYIVDSYIDGSLGFLRRKHKKRYKYSYNDSLTWHLKKHSLCSVHLYLMEQTRDVRDAITFHFVDYDLRKEAPGFIVFWAISYSETVFEKYFQMEQFYGSFTDYRFLIARSPKSRPYHLRFELGLVCVTCQPRKGYGLFNLFPVHIRPWIHTIHTIWTRLHFRHGRHSHRRIYCKKCEFIMRYNKLQKLTMEMYLLQLLNASNYEPHGSNHHRYEASFSSFLPHAIYSSKNTASPSYTFSSSFYCTYDFKMFTVARRSMMAHVGWIAVFRPFPKLVWVVILIFILTVMIVLHKVKQTNEPLNNYIVTFLYLVNPLTDHWDNTYKHIFGKRVIFLWSVVCFSLTVIYGAEESWLRLCQFGLLLGIRNVSLI